LGKDNKKSEGVGTTLCHKCSHKENKDNKNNMPFPGRWWHEPDAKDAFWMSWVSLALTIVAAIGGIVGYVKTESTLILAFGLENVVDFISSAVVLWRFYCPHGVDPAELEKLQQREERASLAISLVIGLLGTFVFGIGILNLIGNDKNQDLDMLFAISFFSIIVFGSLTIIKFQYSQKLDSPSLYKDGICSLIGTFLSGSLLLTTAIIDKAPGAWYIDPIISLLIGICAIWYGFKIVVDMLKSGIPIYLPSWWDSCCGMGWDGVNDMAQDSFGEFIENPAPAEEKDAEHGVI
jgi:Co/Zn/Cd efflux system component